jgi:hypothetical protein
LEKGDSWVVPKGSMAARPMALLVHGPVQERLLRRLIAGKQFAIPIELNLER